MSTEVPLQVVTNAMPNQQNAISSIQKQRTSKVS